MEGPTSKKMRTGQASASSENEEKHDGGCSSHDGPAIPKIVSLREWWYRDLPSTARESGGKAAAAANGLKFLLDLRHPAHAVHDENIPSLSHPNLTVAKIPLADVKARSFELPSRNLPFSILVDPPNGSVGETNSEKNEDSPQNPNIEKAIQFLLFPDRKAANTKRIFRPWKVQHVLVADAKFWNEANELGITIRDEKSQNENIIGAKEDQRNNQSKYPFQVLPRLWESDDMVQNVLLPLLIRTQSQLTGDQNLRIWDMASGAGRDAVFLAEELMAAAYRSEQNSNNLHVTAIDHRYNAKQSQIVRDFFVQRGVGEISSVVKANLSKWETMKTLIDTQGKDLDTSANRGNTTNVLYCVRFYIRSFVQSLARCASLRPGTLFAISHFCIAEPGGVWAFDHPSPDTVLQRTELHDLFVEEDRWAVVHEEIALDSDHGRTMLHFVAKKL